MNINIKGLARDVGSLGHKIPGLRELDTLVRSIGECKSKAEEDRIMAQEVDTLKQRLNSPSLDKSRGREYMVRVMYCEMLGHDASFAYIPCLQFASDANLLTKKAAYLALTQLLDYKHELVLLLVNTLLSDLKSDNWVVSCSALVVTCKLIGPDLVNAVYPIVVNRLTHPKEAVRKKAVMALHHFIRLDPRRTGPLADHDVGGHLRTALCDKDPGVMVAALCALQELASLDPAPYRGLIPSLTSILKQVAEHRLPKSYDYHRVPAPFIQIKLLRVLSKLGAGDKVASDNMAAVVAAALKRATGGQTISNAIIYEAVRTITAIYPNPSLLAAAAEAVTALLRSSSHNLKYCGLDALAGITRVSPKYAVEHQVAVIDCLEDPDDTLKLKTLELLATMTKANNVTVIVERMALYLRGCTDEHVRRDIATKICTLAERYAPDTTWFIKTMAEVFELGGDTLPPSVAHDLMRLIAEQEEEVQATAVGIFMRLLDRPAGRPLPDVLMRTVCWVLGEYGRLADGLPAPERATVTEVMIRLSAAVACSQPSPATRGYLLTALTKLAVAAGGRVPPDVQELWAKGDASVDVELQQRTHEARALVGDPALAAAVLPQDASCEEFDPAEVEAARGLAFLDAHVAAALARGAAPHAPPPELAAMMGGGDLETLESLAAGGGLGGGGHAPHALRFDAYETAVAPAGGAAAAARAGADDLLGMGGGAGGSGLPAGAAAAASSVHGAAAQAYAHQQQQHQQHKQQQQQQGPQLMLKASGPRRWGPAELGGGGQPAASSTAAASYSSSSAAPPAAQQQQQQPASRGASPAFNNRQQAERDKLAASLFGDGGGGGGEAVGIHSGGSKAPPAQQQASLLGDLLGDEDPPQAAAAAAGGSGGGGGGLDLLLDLGDSPAKALPGVAAATGPQAAAAGGFDDLLGGPFSPGGVIMPGTAAAMPPPPMAGGFDAGLLGGFGGAASRPGGGAPGPGAAGAPRPLMPGAMGAKGGGVAGKGGVGSNTPTDPFKDLLG